MSSANINLSSTHGLEGRDVKTVKLEPGLIRRSLQHDKRLGDGNTQKVRNEGLSRVEDATVCSTSLITPAPISRQFWNAGNYDETNNSLTKSTSRTGSNYLHIHPKFLHSNATSHKWAFGAIAELIDNAVDEIQNEATFVIVDKTLNPRDGTSALLIQDDGGGMGPEAMRRCLSFGFSDKKEKTTIGQYGNGFKTSSMRLGADAIVFSRCCNKRKFTMSVGLLSYTFLMHTRHDRIVVPMVDYEFNIQSGSWNSLHGEQYHEKNLSILLQWSPFATEAELLKQCDDVGSHGTRIIIYNLWHDEEGKMELNFEFDPKDIRLSMKKSNAEKVNSRMALSENHLANRLQVSLRAYLSILYLKVPPDFCILLRGQVVEYQSIANDLKFPEFILYKPQNVEGQVITAVGFLKEAPNVNIHGFNVYHKNRLILPFWHVVNYSDSRGRGVVGVLEANFIQPTHNKQEFERTPVFQKLATRLKEMTQEYWDYHCGLIGYLSKKQPRPMVSQFSSDTVQDRGTYQSISLSNHSSIPTGAKVSASAAHEINGSLNCVEPNRGIFRLNSKQGSLKRKGLDHVASPEIKNNSAVRGPRISVLQHAVAPGNHLGSHEVVINAIQENQKLIAQCQEYEKTQEKLNFKVECLRAEIQEAQREYARLLLESKLTQNVEKESRQVK